MTVPPASALPFEPRSFRDFMLFEEHAIAAARGYARRFMPAAYPIANAYERLTGKTFPGFKPKPLWYRQPTYYMGNHLTFVPSGTPIETPSYTQALDYELELGFVLDKPPQRDADRSDGRHRCLRGRVRLLRPRRAEGRDGVRLRPAEVEALHVVDVAHRRSGGRDPAPNRPTYGHH